MATTLRIFASNIQEQLKQTGDDKDVSIAQIVLWSAFFINKFKFSKQLKYKSGEFLTVFPEVPVITPTVSIGNVVKGRKHIVLPQSIFGFENDEGINYMTYTDFDETCSPSLSFVKFIRTAPDKVKRLYFSPYETPTPKNPYFYRTGNIIQLLGIEKINIPSLEVGLVTTFNPFENANALDTELEIGEENLADITAQVLNLGRFMMLMPSDNSNDGSDTNNPNSVPTTKITSVNAQNGTNVPTEQVDNY